MVEIVRPRKHFAMCLSARFPPCLLNWTILVCSTIESLYPKDCIFPLSMAEAGAGFLGIWLGVCKKQHIQWNANSSPSDIDKASGKEYSLRRVPFFMGEGAVNLSFWKSQPCSAEQRSPLYQAFKFPIHRADNILTIYPVKHRQWTMESVNWYFQACRQHEPSFHAKSQINMTFIDNHGGKNENISTTRDVIEPTFLVPEKRISDLPPD